MFKHFTDGRIHHVVSSIVFHQSVYDGCKEVAFNDVPIIKLVFQSDNFAHKSQGSWNNIQQLVEGKTPSIFSIHYEIFDKSLIFALNQ